jgi:hypothetical protein
MGLGGVHMWFFLLGLLFWSLVAGSLLLFIGGIVKKSWKSLLISGVAFLLPSLIIGGAQGWMRMIVIMPWVAFILSYYFRKKVTLSSF